MLWGCRARRFPTIFRTIQGREWSPLIVCGSSSSTRWVRRISPIVRADPPSDDPGRFEEKIDGQPVTLTYGGAGHIMGTYRMGDDPKTSVVNSFQRSHDHNNLYLVGSGTFPTGGTANPTLTLSALALRTADKIVSDLRSRG